MDRLHLIGQKNWFHANIEVKGESIAWVTKENVEQFKNQIVRLYNSGKLKSDICREYDLSLTVITRWIERINAADSARMITERQRNWSLYNFVRK